MSQLQEWYLTKTLASDYTASDCTPAAPARTDHGDVRHLWLRHRAGTTQTRSGNGADAAYHEGARGYGHGREHGTLDAFAEKGIPL